MLKFVCRVCVCYSVTSKLLKGWDEIWNRGRSWSGKHILHYIVSQWNVGKAAGRSWLAILYKV